MSRKTPQGWRPVNLGDVAMESRARNTDLRISPDRLVGVFKDEGMVPMRERVRGTTVERCKVVRPGDFAYNPMRINIGSIARCSASDQLIVSPDYVVFSPDETQIDGLFLEFLRRSDAWAAFVGNAGDGGVRIRIYFEHLAQFCFNLPPLHEQRRIAEILSSVDDAIAATRAVIERTRKVKQGVLERLLSKGIGHIRFKQTEIGEIPEVWETVKLGDVAVSAGGLQTGPFGSQLKAEEYVEDGIPVIMPRDIVSGSISTRQIARITAGKAEKLTIHKLQVGDLVFARRGDIGRFGLISVKEAGFLCGTGCLRARLDVRRVDPKFVSAYLQSPFPIEWLNTNAVGQTMLNLNTSIISQLPLPLPSLDEQTKIIGAIEAIVRSQRINTQKLKQLVSLKSALMSDLLNGRKRVNDMQILAAE